MENRCSLARRSWSYGQCLKETQILVYRKDGGRVLRIMNLESTLIYTWLAFSFYPLKKRTLCKPARVESTLDWSVWRRKRRLFMPFVRQSMLQAYKIKVSLAVYWHLRNVLVDREVMHFFCFRLSNDRLFMC